MMNTGGVSLKLEKFFKKISLSLIMAMLIGLFAGCENVKHIEALEGYTQIKEELVEEADLVLVDGYYAGTGTLNDIVHVRFQAQKDGKISDTIDATQKFFKIVYTDDPKMQGKVKAYNRTYKKGDDVKTHFYYELYSSQDKINDVGELSK